MLDQILNTDQILNFNSNHPIQHKISCIKTIFNRIDTNCNKEQAKQTERRYLYSTVMKNNYSRNFINKILTKIRGKQRVKNSTNNLHEQSNRIVTLLSRIASKCSPRQSTKVQMFNICRCIYSSSKTISITSNNQTKNYKEITKITITN